MKSTSSTIKTAKAGGEVLPARIFLGFLLVAGLAQAFFDYSHDSISLIPCPLHSVSGVPCPGCGMTRACLAVTQGEFGAAWFYHPFAYLLIGAALLPAFAPKLTNQLLARVPQRNRNLSAIFLLGLVLLFWIYRLASGWHG